MKALKEKRVSLRSLIRRGLVILSLFALTFASCSDSDSPVVNTDPTNGTNPPPAGPVFKSITIMAQPTKESYQGFKPDLTDLVIEVEEEGKGRYLVAYNDSPKDFRTVPEYCDTAFLNPDSDASDPTDPKVYGMGKGTYSGQAGPLQLVYKNQAVSNNTPLKIPMVVPADKLESVVSGNVMNWKTDSRPDWTGVTFNVIFDTDWKGLGQNSVKDKPNVYKKLEVASNAAFPLVGYSSLQDYQKITAFIGPVTGAPGRNNSNKVETTIPVKQVGIIGVKVASADWIPITDDDIDVLFTEGQTTADATKLFDVFKKSNVKFEISYSDNTKKTIDTTEFVANNLWYYNLSAVGQGITEQGIKTQLVIADDGLKFPKSNMARLRWDNNSLTQGAVSVLWYGRQADDIEDTDESWTATVNYMPWLFNNSVDYGTVTVAIPVYLFEEARAESSTPGQNALIDGSNSEFTNMDDKILAGLQQKWKLVATYLSGQKRVEKDIPLTKEMFYAGYYGHSIQLQSRTAGATVGANSGWYALTGRGYDGTVGNVSIPGVGTVNKWHPNVSALGYNSVGNSWNNKGLPVGQQRYDFVLPVWYRGIQITDDEGIVVNLMSKN